MFRQFAKSDKRIKRILQIAPNAQGRRVYPPDTAKNNEKLLFRIDQGGPINGKPGVCKLILQVNREAKHRGCQQFIKKYGTHHIVATAEVGEQDKDPNAVIDALYKNALETNFGVGNCNRKK